MKHTRSIGLRRHQQQILLRKGARQCSELNENPDPSGEDDARQPFIDEFTCILSREECQNRCNLESVDQKKNWLRQAAAFSPSIE
jgi:hypothetical protein